MSPVLPAIILLAAAAALPAAYGDEDPRLVLLLQTSEQIERSASGNTSDDIQRLLDLGSAEISLLRDAIAAEDEDAAQKHFQDAMSIYKELAAYIQEDALEPEISAEPQEQGLVERLERATNHVEILREVNAGHGETVDFTGIDALLVSAGAQIESGDYDGARETLGEIRAAASEIETALQQYAEEHALERARMLVERYLGILDNLISEETSPPPGHESTREGAGSPEISERGMELVEMRQRLAAASDSDEITELINQIISRFL